jgi:hypothetical protein
METTEQQKQLDELIEKEISFAKKREIEFNESGMRKFTNVNAAIKYFRSINKQPRSLKSIIWLWQESFEVNAGSVSILVFDYKSDPESFQNRLKSMLKTERQNDLFKKSFEIWVEKTKGIKRIEKSVANQIIKETQTLI